MYCIVETIEEGEKLCSAVPKSWINGNKLHWPKKNSDLIKGRRTCISPKEDWDQFPCKILQENIIDFEEALQQEKTAQYLSCSESSGVEATQSKKMNTSVSNIPFHLESFNLNDLVIIGNSPKQLNSSSLVTYVQNTPIKEKILLDSIMESSEMATTNLLSPESPIMAGNAECTCCLTSVKMELKALKGQMQEMNEKLSTQNLERKQFEAQMQVTLNLILEKFHAISEDSQKENISQEQLNNFPIETLEQLDECDMKIRSDAFYKQILLRRLSRFGGSDGARTARTMVNFLFADKLLVLFSWSGTSTKRNFCAYKDIFNLIIQAVRRTHVNFTEHDGSKFLKEHLKHAGTRIKRKNVTLTPIETNTNNQ